MYRLRTFFILSRLMFSSNRDDSKRILVIQKVGVIQQIKYNSSSNPVIAGGLLQLWENGLVGVDDMCSANHIREIIWSDLVIFANPIQQLQFHKLASFKNIYGKQMSRLIFSMANKGFIWRTVFVIYYCGVGGVITKEVGASASGCEKRVLERAFRRAVGTC